MTEKQASSEIAQSRERFEKAGRHLGLSLFFAYDHSRGYVDSDTWKAFEMWQAAERDTRERCAQEIEEKAALKGMYLKWLVKAIRGKE